MDELFVGANSSVIADTVSDWNGVPLGMLVLKRGEAILRQKAMHQQKAGLLWKA